MYTQRLASAKADSREGAGCAQERLRAGRAEEESVCVHGWRSAGSDQLQGSCPHLIHVIICSRDTWAAKIHSRQWSWGGGEDGYEMDSSQPS